MKLKYGTLKATNNVDVHSVAEEENYRSTSSEACIINRAANLVRETSYFK